MLSGNGDLRLSIERIIHNTTWQGYRFHTFRAIYVSSASGQLSVLLRLLGGLARVPVLVVDYFVYRQAASGFGSGAECGFGVLWVAKGQHHEQVEIVGVAEDLTRGLGPVQGNYAGADA